MDNLSKAKIILEELEKTIQIDANFETTYLKAIMRGLQFIDNGGAKDESS